jgi:hypothetical protein
MHPLVTADIILGSPFLSKLDNQTMRPVFGIINRYEVVFSSRMKRKW